MLPCALACCINLGFSQKIYFPRANYQDSTTIETSLPGLARIVLEKYKNPQPFAYYNNLFKLQITAKDYTAALATLDSLPIASEAQGTNPYLAKAAGFEYAVYCEAMTANGNSIKKETYQACFDKRFRLLSIGVQQRAENRFQTSLLSLQEEMDKNINTCRYKDSLSITEALGLCKSYTTYEVFKTTLHLAKEHIANLYKDKYIYTDSVLVKMPDAAPYH